jgi:hypothetical protein
MQTPSLLPKDEYPKDKPLVKIIPAQPNTKKVAGTDVPNNKKVKVIEKKKFFNTEDIFKAKKHELF